MSSRFEIVFLKKYLIMLLTVPTRHVKLDRLDIVSSQLASPQNVQIAMSVHVHDGPRFLSKMAVMADAGNILRF